MTPTVAVLSALDSILESLVTEAASGGCPLDLPPCRVGLYPGGVVAFDSCESGDCSDGDGQLWANLQPFTVTGSAPCYNARFTAEIGIVRCAKARPTESKPIPRIEDVLADAWQQALDADQILNALTCCTFGDPESGRDTLSVTGWRPIDNQGGCVGGIWTVSGTLQFCCES